MCMWDDINICTIVSNRRIIVAFCKQSINQFALVVCDEIKPTDRGSEECKRRID